MKTIYKVDRTVFSAPKRTRVAAYARISKETERMSHSLSAQISYYNQLIQSNPNWEFVGVYADDAVTGTSTTGRENFQRMLEACEQGEIDIILTKSISRFARNTVDLLNTTRRLKGLGVEVRFEKEHINTLSEDGELMLTLLSSFAQAESESISENIRWFIKSSYEEGRVLHKRVYGYRIEDKTIVPDENEAPMVQRIFRLFLEGNALRKIADNLNSEGLTHNNGRPFDFGFIRDILGNERYTGDTLLQKTWTESALNRKRHMNKGERPMYYVENTHEAIISHEDFDRVQEELKRRESEGCFCAPSFQRSPFTSFIQCAMCGRNYVKVRYQCKYILWACRSRKEGLCECRSKGINERQLEKLVCRILGMEEFDSERMKSAISRIIASGDGHFTFLFHDGHEITEYINSKSEACKEIWRDPVKRQQILEKRRQTYAERKKNTRNG